jgi:4-hydroxybenzoate polyprenyltransferase
VIAAGVLFIWQQWLIRKREPAGCLHAFLNNQYVGLAVFIGVFLQYVYAR